VDVLAVFMVLCSAWCITLFIRIKIDCAIRQPILTTSGFFRKIPVHDMFNLVHDYKATPPHFSDDDLRRKFAYIWENTVLLFIQTIIYIYIFFNVLLTVHLSIILVTDQLNAQILIFFYFHVFTVQ